MESDEPDQGDVMDSNDDHDDDFPLEEQVEDFAGNLKTFVIDCHEGPLGFTVRAQEKGRAGLGYEFGAYSETSPYNALYRVRKKMYRALATKHITQAPGTIGGYRMLHDRVSGRITSDGQGGVLLVVDAIPLSLEEFGVLLAAHEGWTFDLQITDGLE
jgi:hypothetical protein